MSASRVGKEPPSESNVAPFNLDEADDLRRSFMSAMVGLVGMLAWITAVRASGCTGGTVISCGWLTPISLGVSAFIAYVSRNRPPRIACSAFMMCLIVSAEIEWLFASTQATPYFFALLVIVASMLFSARGALATVALALLGLAGGASFNTISYVHIGAPIIFLLFSSVVAWLGTRQFLTALAWASFSNHQAQAAAADAQQHRAELVVRSHDLDQAYSRLERMNQMLVLARQYAESARIQKSQFANAVSHELRSPINMIIGFSEMMVNAPEVYIGQQWTPRLSQHLAHVYKSGQHLSQLIDDVLDLARIDSYRMTLNKQRADMNEIIAGAIEITRELFSARGLYLNAQSQPGLPGLVLDQIRIRQVLLNLITNAARFTTTGGVTVRAYVHESEVRIEVEDTGPGIPPAELAGLFQEFYQGESNLYRQGRGGSGLGLVISKRLVEQHGGRIWAESLHGSGSRFVFALPIESRIINNSLMQRTAGDDGWWPALERDARKRMRLLVKADESARRLITTSLAKFDLIWIDNNMELQAQIADQYPLALVCAGSPMLGGQLPDARSLAQLGELPVIVCSLPGRALENLPFPFVGALVKPVGRDQLRKVLHGLGCRINQILVVDDDPGMVEFLSVALNAIDPGWQIHTAADAKQALTLMHTCEPDVVLLDFGLPDTNGRDLAVKLHEVRDVRIVAVTAEELASAMTRSEMDSITCTRTGHFSQMELETMLESIAKAIVPSANNLAQHT